MSGWIQTWINVLTRPGEATFAEERQRPDANLVTALIWMAIAAVVSGIVAIITGFVFRGQMQAAGGWQGIVNQFDLPEETMQIIEGTLLNVSQTATSPAAIIGAGIWAVVWSLLGFLILVGILFLVARVLGGTGNFGRYAYLIAAFGAPLSILSSLLGFIPLLGPCIGLLLAIYGLVLTYFATKVEHGFTQGRAIATVLIPFAIVIVLGICFTTVLAGFIVTIMGAQ